MLVSAVIPVYNRPRLVARAVGSVLAQDWPELELIVVDDGSTDRTPEVLADLAGESGGRMRVLTQENRGVGAARNAGIYKARGELFAFLDSDDEWLPRKISRQVAFLMQLGLEICQTQEIWMRGGRRVNAPQRHVKPSGRFFAQALGQCLVSPSCTMFTRRFLGEVGCFDETLPACEDYDLWLRALTRFDIGLLDEELTVRHGGRSDQLSTLFTGLDLFRVRSLAKLLASGRLTPEQGALARREMEARAQVYVAGCVKRGRLHEARRVEALVAEVAEAAR